MAPLDPTVNPITLTWSDLSQATVYVSAATGPTPDTMTLNIQTTVVTPPRRIPVPAPRPPAPPPGGH
jgi:hypothetical protein